MLRRLAIANTKRGKSDAKKKGEEESFCESFTHILVDFEMTRIK
jgi:hypothetical protein